jgi:hypothetical protein
VVEPCDVTTPGVDEVIGVPMSTLSAVATDVNVATRSDGALSEYTGAEDVADESASRPVNV